MGERKFGAGPEDFQQAEDLAYHMERVWRYDHTSERWHHWNGTRWAPDDTRQVENRVAEIATDQMRQALLDGDENRKKALVKLLSLPAIRRALEALATFKDYGTNGDDWDSQPFLLGTEDGIVDLRTNTLIPRPDPSMLVTKSTGTNFRQVSGPSEFGYFDKEEGMPSEWEGPHGAAPYFMTSMRQWMSGDESMVAFLLLWFGASMFGFTPEQRFLLMTGIGRNGKGALKHSVMHAVGDYGGQFDSNLYMRSRFGAARSDQARADLIALKGKRITFFSEPEGGKFNDELLKAHTGGDRITARALHSNNVQSWDPTHSITFLVNNAPEVEDLGPSMAARVMVADFRERYDGDKEDKRLYGKLEREAAGILGILCWAAAAWYRSWSNDEGGIELPERVVEQSKAFMERNDPVANWLNDRVLFGQDLTAPARVAYESYLGWFRDSGLVGEAVSEVRFAQELAKKGFSKAKTRTGIRWTGFKMLSAMDIAERGVDEDEEP